MGLVEKTEKNKVKFTLTVSPARFKEGLQYSYNKNKGRVMVHGFRKGKAPRRIIESQFGKDFFYDDAINFVLPEAYEAALDENQIEPVYKPEIHLDEANEETGVVFTVEVYVKPEVEVDGYYGLSYPDMATEPTEDEVQSVLQSEREKNARLLSVDRPAENGDVVTINFTGYIDGEPFEGGKGENYDLTLGSSNFIDNFETQLIGSRAGDELDVNVTFPTEYHEESLSGKPALFKVEILDVKERELPELNDEFAQDTSEYENLADYRSNICDKLREEKVRIALAQKENSVIQKLLEKAVMEVPEVMYTARVDEMVQELQQRLEQQQITMELYLTYNRMTEEELRSRYYTTAKQETDAALVLEAVAKKENLSVSEEEWRAQAEKMALSANMEPEDVITRIRPERKKEIMHALLNQKAFNFVLEQAVAIAPEAV